MIKIYKKVCLYCKKSFKTRFKKQIFCSRKCSGLLNQKKRNYKNQKTKIRYIDKKTGDLKNDITFTSTGVSTHRKHGYNKNEASRRTLKYPESEYELYEYIKNHDIISKPCMIKIIKTMESYRKYAENS